MGNSRGTIRRTTSRALLAVLVAVGLVVPLTASTAHAAGWTNLGLQWGLQPYYSSARVCKTYEVGGYGPVWKYRFEMYKKNPYQQARMMAGVLRDNQFWLSPYPAVSNDQWWYGVGGSLYVYGSALHDDQIQFLASDSYYWNQLLVGGKAVYHSWEIATC